MERDGRSEVGGEAGFWARDKMGVWGLQVEGVIRVRKCAVCSLLEATAATEIYTEAIVGSVRCV